MSSVTRRSHAGPTCCSPRKALLTLWLSAARPPAARSLSASAARSARAAVSLSQALSPLGPIAPVLASAGAGPATGVSTASQGAASARRIATACGLRRSMDVPHLAPPEEGGRAHDSSAPARDLGPGLADRRRWERYRCWLKEAFFGRRKTAPGDSAGGRRM